MPAELATYLTPEKISDLQHGVEQYVVRRVAGMIGNAVWRAIWSRLRPHADTDSMPMLAQRISRLEAFVAGIEQANASAGSPDTARIAEEPAFQSFIADAADSAMRSASEGKRLLLGRLTAKRAAVQADSMADLRMRAALRLVDETTIQQLYAMVAIYFVAHPPLPDVGQRDVPSIYRDLDERYAAIFELAANAIWTAEDLEYLEAIGAVRSITDDGVGSRLERRLAPGGPYWPIPMGEIPTSAYLDLARMLDTAEAAPSSKPPLGRLALTPIGFQVALAVIESLETTA